MFCGNTFRSSIVRHGRRRDAAENVTLSQTQAYIYLCWIELFVLFHLCVCVYVCVGWEEVSGGTQCHLKRSAWRHSIRNITPWCQAHIYKQSLNDTQLAAWRQLSLPSLRPNLSLPPSMCLSLCFPPLSHSGVQLGCLPFLLPPPSLQDPDFVEPKLQKLTSWSWCSLPLLFVGLPALPLWSDRSELTLWERLPDARTAGEIILSFCLCQDFFFFYLSICFSRGLLFPLYCFSIYSAKLQVYFVTMQNESDPPEIDHLLKEQTNETQHPRTMSLTDITRLKANSCSCVEARP